MEKYLPAERTAQADTGRLVVSRTRAAAFKIPRASLHGSAPSGGRQMFALVGLCYKWTWFCLVG